VIGDAHFQDKNVPESKLLSEKVYTLIKANKYDFVVVLGDLVHSHETLKMFPYNLAVSFLKTLSKLLPTFFLVGNHEKVSNNIFQTNDHPYVALEDYPNLNIVYKAQYTQIGSHNYFFCAYTPNGRFYEALLTSCDDESQLQQRLQSTTAIFAHQEFKGCQLGPIKSTKGDVWGLEKPLVISGHIHTFEILQPNIIYTGSPSQVTFDDSCDKTISHFIFEGKQFKHQRIDLGMPKKRIIKINIAELQDFKAPENTQIKLKIIGTDAEIKVAMKTDKIKELEKAGILISYNTLATKKSFDPVGKKELLYIPRLQSTVASIPRLGDLLKKFL
jgi:DNA repair exonuclease SbcCD nuclease subunit